MLKLSIWKRNLATFSMDKMETFVEESNSMSTETQIHTEDVSKVEKELCKNNTTKLK